MTALHVALNPLPLTLLLLWKLTVIFLPELVMGLGFRKVQSIHLFIIIFYIPPVIALLELYPLLFQLFDSKLLFNWLLIYNWLRWIKWPLPYCSHNMPVWKTRGWLEHSPWYSRYYSPNQKYQRWALSGLKEPPAPMSDNDCCR